MKRWPSAKLSPRLSLGLRLACTLALLGLLAWQLDTGELVERLSQLDLAWALLAVAISVPQVVISAWRWRLTARQVGIRLRWPSAIREYYLATFLNQVLPGGMMGDAARAWRHGNVALDSARDRANNNAQGLADNSSQDRAGDSAASGAIENRVEGPAQSDTDSPDLSRSRAIHAVILERASGQLALILVAIVTITISPTLRDGIVLAIASLGGWPLVASIATLLALVGLALGWSHRMPAVLKAFSSDLRLALLRSKVWPLQLISSLLVVGTYVAVFLCAAQALGSQRSVFELLPLIPPLLMAMAIPLTIAGWGVREGAASLIWPLAGLPAQEGVTLSVTYGLLILAGSLPGLIILAVDRRPSGPRYREKTRHAEKQPRQSTYSQSTYSQSTSSQTAYSQSAASQTAASQSQTRARMAKGETG